MLIAALHRRGIRFPRWVAIALFTIAALALVAATALAQAPRPHGFVYLLGADTLGVERVTPAGNLVMGDIQMRGQPRLQWTATLAGPGRVQSISLAAFRSVEADAPVLQRATMELVGDSVRFEATAGTGPAQKRMLSTKAGAFMLVNASAAMTDLMLDRARATPAPHDTFPVFLTTGGQTVDSHIHIWGDSATIGLGPTTSRAGLGPDGRLREIVVPGQNLRMVRVEGAAYDALKVGAPDYNAPAGAPYRAEHVKVPATGGHQLAATLTMPQGATGRVPAVVTISGSGGQDRDEYIPLVPGFRPFRQVADTLGRRGIAVLRFDDRGIGESGGSFVGSTSADFAEDVRSLVRWLRARPDIDPDRIFLLGHSEGGLIAPMVAAGDARLAGIVLMAGPAQKGRDVLRYQQRFAVAGDSSLRTQAQRDSAMRVIEAQTDTLGMRDKWMGFFFTHDPLATARRVKVPVLIAQGATDRQVTADQAETLAAALRAGGNRDVTVKVFADRNHLFLPDPDGNPAGYVRLPSGRIGADVLGPIADWVARHATR